MASFEEWLELKGWKRCQYKSQSCKRGCEIEGSEDEGIICTSKKGCVYEVVHDEVGIVSSFKDTLKKSPYWTLRGTDHPTGKVVIDHMVLTAICNWAGDSTLEHEDRTKEEQYEMMYNALDLIYKLLEEITEGPIKACKKEDGKWVHWKIDEMTKLIPLLIQVGQKNGDQK
jgi:hypothetical protein